MTDSDCSDANLVRAARGGDLDAFAILLERHRPLLLSLCRRVLRDEALAEDAAQEASLRAMLRLHSLEDVDRFGAWLAGIGMNVSRMWLRVRTRECSSWNVIEGVRDDSPGPESEAVTADLSARVRSTVAGLPRGQQSAVSLFYLSGLSYAETAAKLGIEMGAVRTRLHKARSTLRRELREFSERDMMMEGETKRYTCSFCGKPNEEVRRTIAGPGGVAICNECVDLCNELIVDAGAKETA